MKNKFISGIIIASIGLALPSGYAMENGSISVEEARTLLSTEKSIQARYDFVDVTQEDPQSALDTSNAHFQYGMPWALHNINEHTSDSSLISAAKTMGDIFESGKIHLPTDIDLANSDLKNAVRQVYDLILGTFCWKDGHTDEVTPSEVAAHMVTRERLKKLQSLWV